MNFQQKGHFQALKQGSFLLKQYLTMKNLGSQNKMKIQHTSSYLKDRRGKSVLQQVKIDRLGKSNRQLTLLLNNSLHYICYKMKALKPQWSLKMSQLHKECNFELLQSNKIQAHKYYKLNRQHLNAGQLDKDCMMQNLQLKTHLLHM